MMAVAAAVDNGNKYGLLVLLLLIVTLVEETGSLRRSKEEVTEDYDEIDRASPPLFVNNTRTKLAVAAGKDVALECRVRNLGDRAVSWIRQSDLHILSLGNIVFTTDTRHYVVHSNESSSQHSDWLLNIKDAQVGDSGIYECQINTEPKRSKAYHLSVVVSNARIYGDRDVFVHQSSDINLTCRTEDAPSPPAAVTWLKDGVRIDAMLERGGISVVTETKKRSSRLLVSRVNPADAGNYTCAPANAKIDSVTVHVIDGADPRANVMASQAAVAAADAGFVTVGYWGVLVALDVFAFRS